MKFDKKKITKILPFIMLGYFANKLSQAFTSADGSQLGDIIMNGVRNIGQVFHNPLPSFNPVDLLVTSDADPKNLFDIEKFLNHKLKIKPDTVVEVYDCGEAEETEDTAE